MADNDVDLVALAAHAADRTAERVRKDWKEDLEDFGNELRQAWNRDLSTLRDDLTAKGLLVDLQRVTGTVESTCVVLVVDDHPEVLRSFRRVLEATGISVREASSGAAAAELLDSDGSIEVVITDLTMPKNGYTLIEHIHKVHPTLAVIVTSGYGLDLPRLKELNAFGFLPKPFSLVEAVLLIERAAEFRRMKIAVSKG